MHERDTPTVVASAAETDDTVTNADANQPDQANTSSNDSNDDANDKNSDGAANGSDTNASSTTESAEH